MPYTLFVSRLTKGALLKRSVKRSVNKALRWLMEKTNVWSKIASLVLCASALHANVHAQPAGQPIAQSHTTDVVYIKIKRTAPAGTPSYLARPDDEGIAGASIGIEDANITGRFLGYSLSLVQLNAFDSDATTAIARAPVVLIDSPDAQYQQAVHSVESINPKALIINVASGKDAFRHIHCESNVLHTYPSYQMKTDALGQWLRTKRLSSVLTIQGPHESDKAYINAFLRTAKKFKLNVVEAKIWQASFDLRRSAFSEIPLFTRTKKPYDAIFAADNQRQYAYSLPFNTHLIVPIMGSAGLKPLGWHFTHEQWGARQLQNRFKTTFSRTMNDVDFAAYTAIIAISTALQHRENNSAKNNAPQKHEPVTGTQLFNALVGEQLSVAAYKGRQLTFRESTRQLRQPIALAHEDALVIHAPLPGFLHQRDELDTLGDTTNTCKDTL
jgi:ABC transporter substrate binding protein (PQQ-dependent alcohol dehydrogenase system)